jgi:hypothetical protein
MKYILLVGMASAQHCRKIDIDKSSGFCTVPDPKLTPGEMDASLACVSNSDRPRNVSNAEKNANHLDGTDVSLELILCDSHGSCGNAVVIRHLHD